MLDRRGSIDGGVATEFYLTVEWGMVFQQGNEDGAAPAALRAELNTATRAMDREIAKIRRAEEARARQAEREAQREARRQAALEAREAARERQRARRANSCAVQCCDGTCSPTCAYVHRGCCSHHGGVCG